MVDIARIDRLVVSAVERDGELELLQVGLDRRGHVRILQLAGQIPAILALGAVDLAKGCGSGGLVRELLKLVLPIGAQFAAHAPAHEWPAHSRGLRLQLAQFLGVAFRQRIGNGCQDLRDFHQRTFELSQGRAQIGGMPVLVEAGLEEPGECRLSGQAADAAADGGITLDASAQARSFPLVRFSFHGQIPGGRSLPFSSFPQARR